MHHLLAPCSRVLLEKLTGLQLVKKFPSFYGTRRFITAFISARQVSLSEASVIQSTPSHPTSWRSILILSSHLRLGLPSITKYSNQILMMKPNWKFKRNNFNNFRSEKSVCFYMWRFFTLESTERRLNTDVTVEQWTFLFNWFPVGILTTNSRIEKCFGTISRTVWILANLCQDISSCERPATITNKKQHAQMAFVFITSIVKRIWSWIDFKERRQNSSWQNLP